MALQPSVEFQERVKALTETMDKSISESLLLLERVRHSMAHSDEMLARSRDQISQWREGIDPRASPEPSSDASLSV